MTKPTFQLTSVDDSSIVVIFDYSNLANRVYFATKDQRYLKSSFLNRVSEYLYKLEHFKKIALVWAIDSHPTRKLSYYPAYKGNRPERDVDPKQAMIEYIYHYTSTVIKADGEEADDVIASFLEKHPQKKVILVTNDKDMDQLIGKNLCTVVDPKTDRRRTEELCVDQFGVKPHCVALFKTVFGDSGDNVKPAVKRLRKDPILPFIDRASGDLHEFLNIVNSDTSFPEKAKVDLLAASGYLFMNWKLVNLKTDIDYVSESIVPLESQKVA